MRLTTGVLAIAITCFLGPMALLTESHAEAGADLQQSCNDYASVMDAKLSEARSLNCEFIHGSGGWDVNRDFFVKQCVDAQANYRGLRANESGLQKSLDACKSAEQQSCNAYASRMEAKLSEARHLNCEFIHGSGGWDVNRDFFVKQCVDSKDSKVNVRGLAANESGLQKSLDACKSAHAGGGGTLKVVAEVTMYNMYDPKRNKDLCYLHPGDTLTKLSPDGAKAPWMHLKGTSGGCNGKTGYVYNDGKLQ
jgi:hypothetical protein